MRSPGKLRDGAWAGMSLKIAVLGVGGYGRTIVRELADDPRVTDLILVDRRADRARVLLPLLRKTSVSVHDRDVEDARVLRRVLSEADVAINLTPERYNVGVMSCCLDAGCSYLDISSFQPTTRGERGGIRSQLDQDELWRDRGLSAIVCMGSDPGLSNIMARIASDRLRTVDTIRIRKAVSAGKDIEGFRSYSRESFVEDALCAPTVWEDGRFVEREPASEEEDFDFPPPVGKRRVSLFPHEEVATLPLRLPKRVRRVDYKHAVRPELVRAILALRDLGFLSPNRSISMCGQRVAFRDAFLAALPEPSTLTSLSTGALAIVVEAQGTNGEGELATVRGWAVMENREASAKRQTTPEHFLASIAAVTGAILVGMKRTPRAGVLVPEELPPEIVVGELESRGLRFHFAPATDSGASLP